MNETIRTGRLEDLAAITEIYNHYVATTAVSFDTKTFSVQERRKWFEAFSDVGPHRIFVATRAAAVVGYAGSHRFRPRDAYATSVETMVYLAPQSVGRGLGSRLYEALIDSLRAAEVHRAYGGVALPNPASVGLHHRLGFRSVGIYREVGRKFGRYWDVEWFEKALG